MAKNVIDVTFLLASMIGDLEDKLQLAIVKDLGPKIGRISAVTIQQQMRAKGVKRAKATGTHNKRSKKEKAAANRYGSMLDTYYKVHKVKELNYYMIFAGQTQAYYKARMVNSGFNNHHYWGKNSGNSVAGKHFYESSIKIIKTGLPGMIKQSMRRALANPKKFKRQYRIG